MSEQQAETFIIQPGTLEFVGLSACCGSSEYRVPLTIISSAGVTTGDRSPKWCTGCERFVS
ncbi:hypothetical protein B7C42_01627 [Nocardia cerradoensis]|uniref:Uncharacterized protein n=1 Tax=Nocardia cerradoensis TaxID=85688 RepID=A0A231HCH4_9NOCA|nr:hypothetical protein [Nocardia cerradoensis]OXR46653.1 hypothetical protein B7C42_01627 [Nocardia cerradoensis]